MSLHQRLPPRHRQDVTVSQGTFSNTQWQNYAPPTKLRSRESHIKSFHKPFSFYTNPNTLVSFLFDDFSLNVFTEHHLVELLFDALNPRKQTWHGHILAHRAGPHFIYNVITGSIEQEFDAFGSRMRSQRSKNGNFLMRGFTSDTNFIVAEYDKNTGQRIHVWEKTASYVKLVEIGERIFALRQQQTTHVFTRGRQGFEEAPEYYFILELSNRNIITQNSDATELNIYDESFSFIKALSLLEPLYQLQECKSRPNVLIGVNGSQDLCTLDTHIGKMYQLPSLVQESIGWILTLSNGLIAVGAMTSIVIIKDEKIVHSMESVLSKNAEEIEPGVIGFTQAGSNICVYNTNLHELETYNANLNFIQFVY